MSKDNIPSDKLSITLTRRQWIMICWMLLPEWHNIYLDGFFNSTEVRRAAKSLEKQIPPARTTL